MNKFMKKSTGAYFQKSQTEKNVILTLKPGANVIELFFSVIY
jgi:hypothetical protein